jgi:ASC-1-like (ASCH) protein
MRRHLGIRPQWEDALRSGRKTIDARLVADDMADLFVGHVVRYPGARLRVRAMRFYHSFSDLLAHEDWRKIAPDAASRDEALQLLEEGHRETERETGAVAIELEPEHQPAVHKS